MFSATIAPAQLAEDQRCRPATRAGATSCGAVERRAPAWLREAKPAHLLARYIEGWAEADPRKIIQATAPGYTFDDPVVGAFSKVTLGCYFKRLEAQFELPGIATQRASFRLHGPIDPRDGGRLQFWREAVGLGLTGTSRIIVGARGVLAESVAYDLNMALNQLRRAN